MTIDRDDLSPEVSVPAATVPPRPRRTRWPVVALVAAVLVVGVVVAVVVVRSGRDGDAGDPIAVVTPSPTATATAPAALVVHDGDRVEGAGEVYAVPGEPVRFCAPAPVGLGGSAGTEAPPPLVECPFGVTVTGVDLASLAERRTVGDAVSGYAHLVGTYRAGALTVQDQLPYVRAAPPGPGFDDTPPCPAPDGGWPQGPADTDIDTGPLTAYEAAHPDEVVGAATLRPTSTQAVAYLLTSGDAAATADALRAHYGQALCVAHTDVTPSRLHAARSAFTAAVTGAGTTSDVYEVSDENITPPPVVGVGCVLVTPDLAATAARFPDLVRFDPFLAPVA